MPSNDLVLLDTLREHTKRALEAVRAQSTYRESGKGWSVHAFKHRGKATVSAWCNDDAVMDVFDDEMRGQGLKVESGKHGAIYIQER